MDCSFPGCIDTSVQSGLPLCGLAGQENSDTNPDYWRCWGAPAATEECVSCSRSGYICACMRTFAKTLPSCPGHICTALSTLVFKLHAGATGGVGKRVVQTLLNQGKAVRAAVRDGEKGRRMLVYTHQTVLAACTSSVDIDVASLGLSLPGCAMSVVVVWCFIVASHERPGCKFAF